MGALLASPADIKSKATDHRETETRWKTPGDGTDWVGLARFQGRRPGGARWCRWPMVQHFNFGLETNIVIPQQRLRALQAIPCALARRLPCPCLGAHSRSSALGTTGFTGTDRALLAPGKGACYSATPGNLQPLSSFSSRSKSPALRSRSLVPEASAKWVAQQNSNDCCKLDCGVSPAVETHTGPPQQV